MSFVVVGPDVLVSAAADVARIGSGVGAANAAAAARRRRWWRRPVMRCRRRLRRCFLATPGFQALSAQAAAFHAEFVQALTARAGAYAAAEAANASPLQTVEQDMLGVIMRPPKRCWGVR